MIPSTTLHLDAAQALVSLQTVPKEQQQQQNVRQNFFAASNKFPEILMEIVSNPRNQEYIQWICHGKAFMIKDRKKFISDVLPRYFFAEAKYTSFTRRLNRWRFKCYSTSPKSCVYYHPDFLRDSPELCKQIKGCGNNSKRRRTSSK